MTLDDLPEGTRLAYGHLDPTRGVLEIKASRTTNKIRGDKRNHAYYYPQVYIEMLAARTSWAQLIRYHEFVLVEHDTGKWKNVYECMSYMIYLHQETLQALISCLEAALAMDAEHFVEFVTKNHTHAVMRRYFQALADECVGEPLTVDVAMCEAFQKPPQQHHAPIPASLLKKDPVQLELEETTMEICDGLELGHDITALAIRQIQLLALLMQQQQSSNSSNGKNK